MHVRVILSRYRGYTLCPDCGGAGCAQEALDVRVAGKTIADVARDDLEQAHGFFETSSLRRSSARDRRASCWSKSASACSS